MNYYNNVKHLITQTHIDVNYENESTVKFDGLKMSLITFCKRDPQMTFVPTLHIILVINSYGNHNKIVLIFTLDTLMLCFKVHPIFKHYLINFSTFDSAKQLN